MFSLSVELHSNPDRDHGDWSETHVLQAPTMAELRKAVNTLQADYGGGNWGIAILTKNGEMIGYMSWNGRIWKNKYWESNSFDEVVLTDDNF